MQYNPLVSIVTPTYNRANFIKKTIKSVLSQTYSNFEYFILDDGSTDNTEDIVKPYLSDKRVKYIKHENVGEVETVNIGWKLAIGDYFLQINSDDVLFSNCVEEIINVLEKDKRFVLAYPDFLFIDAEGKTLQEVKSPDWNFIKALSNFSCYAASAGTMIRKSSFENWKELKSPKFKYINDVEMYWNMALIGNFVHIPMILAKWRKHDANISHNRYESIIEIKAWYQGYFSKNRFSDYVKNKTKESIELYVEELYKSSNMNHIKKREIYKSYQGIELYNLQIGDNDLIGNKFNGHDLHIYLRERKIYSDHLVLNKQSDDVNTYIISSQKDINTLNSILYNDSFLKSDIIHLHLIHNNVMDISLLPVITKLKPTVWTIHDPWAIGGHCVHHFDCEKWKTHCNECPYLDKPFAIEYDDTALRFEMKKQAIQNSQISAIVASKWMEDKIKQSPIWAGKKIYRIPFGINQTIFKPGDIVEAKKKLNIDHSDFVLFFRSDPSPYKGIEILKETLNKIKSKRKITILTVGMIGLLEDFKEKYKIKEFGWITDDSRLVELYQACNMFLMPSRQETFGMMAIEAMSCGKLVIVLSTNTSALSEIINAPECGIAISEEEYTSEIQRLIDNPDEIIAREQKSLEFARSNYNKDVYIRKIIEVYKDIINNHKLDKSSEYILQQPQINVSKIQQFSKKRLMLWYKYLIRPFLRLLLSKHKVKSSYDRRFKK